VETHSFSQLLVNSVTMEIRTTEMVALLLVRLNHFGNAQLLKVLFQHAKRFVEMENLKVHIQKFVTMTMKLMVMDVRQLAKLKQTGNALELKELQAHASL
jgi:hypothetical protein